MNSFGGHAKESLFITFSFDHVHDHRPTNCSVNPNEATLDKYQFSELEIEEMKRQEADKIRHQGYLNHTREVHNEGEDDHVHDGSLEVDSEEQMAKSYL